MYCLFGYDLLSDEGLYDGAPAYAGGGKAGGPLGGSAESFASRPRRSGISGVASGNRATNVSRAEPRGQAAFHRQRRSTRRTACSPSPVTSWEPSSEYEALFGGCKRPAAH